MNRTGIPRHKLAEYQRAYREQNPESVERDRLQNRAYRPAERALRERHRAEFEAIYGEERRQRGLS